MDRAEFLNLCQRASMIPERIKGVKHNIPKELLVRYNNTTYYPYGYQLTFDNQGNTIHTAILHDMYASSVIYCGLERVDKYD